MKSKYLEAKKVHDQKKEKARSFHQMLKNKETDVLELKTAIKEMEKYENKLLLLKKRNLI